MALIRVPENKITEKLCEFYNTSCFTFEGLDISDKKNLKALENILRSTGFEEKHFEMWWFTGKEMNEVYGLTESNAYPDDLTFVCIPNYYNPLVKIEIHARWFDDIVDNNSIKQRGIIGGISPDFDIDEDTDE